VDDEEGMVGIVFSSVDAARLQDEAVSGQQRPDSVLCPECTSPAEDGPQIVVCRGTSRRVPGPILLTMGDPG